MTRSVRLVLVFRHYCNSCLRRIIQMSHVPRKYKRTNKNRLRAKLSSSQIRLLQHSRHHCSLKICNSWLSCTMKRGSQELAHSVLDDLKPSHYCIKHANRSKYSTKLLTPQDWLLKRCRNNLAVLNHRLWRQITLQKLKLNVVKRKSRLLNKDLQAPSANKQITLQLSLIRERVQFCQYLKVAEVVPRRSSRLSNPIGIAKRRKKIVPFWIKQKSNKRQKSPGNLGCATISVTAGQTHL